MATVVRDAWEMVPDDDVTLRVPATADLEADESRLRRLLESLFSNAVAHNETPLTVEVGDLEDGFYVADDGTGVDPKLRDRVSEPGFTTDGGTGLGLAIVAGIADAQGWSCTLAESESGGTRFESTGVSRP